MNNKAKAQKEKENLKKAELEAERIKQEKLKQEELIRQRELAKPKPLISTPQPQILSASKPKESVDKPVFVSNPSPAMPPMNSLPKSLFGTEKPQLPFGTTIEKSIPEPSQSTGNLSVGKGMSFDGASTTSSGFGFAAKSEASSVFGSTPLSGFSFGASTKTSPAFGLSPQPKSDALNLPKPTVTTAPIVSKPPLLVTPTSANEKPKLLNPPVSKPITPGASVGVSSSSTSSPLQNMPVAKPALLSTPNIPPTATSNTFKFDLGSSFSVTTTDKSKNDKENSPAPTSVPITQNNSINSFSFSLGSTSASQSPLAISSTSLTVQATTASSVATTQASNVVVSSTPPVTSILTSKPSSSIGFSFAQASAESSIFGKNTATTNVVTTTTGAVVSSSTDPSNVFQSFNICKPNVSESSNGKFLL